MKQNRQADCQRIQKKTVATDLEIRRAWQTMYMNWRLNFDIINTRRMVKSQRAKSIWDWYHSSSPFVASLSFRPPSKLNLGPFLGSKKNPMICNPWRVTVRTKMQMS